MGNLPTLPGCGRPATVRIEIYSARNGMLHGSLDGAAYGCDEHLAEVVDAIRAAGFTPFTVPGAVRAPGARCGSGVDYTDPTGMRTIAAPEPAATVRQTETVVSATETTHVPSWCTQGTLCTQEAVHASKPLLANLHRGAEFAAVRLWLEQIRGESATPVIVMEVAEDGEVVDYHLPLHQGQLLAHHLITLIGTAGGVR